MVSGHLQHEVTLDLGGNLMQALLTLHYFLARQLSLGLLIWQLSKVSVQCSRSYQFVDFFQHLESFLDCLVTDIDVVNSFERLDNGVLNLVEGILRL